MTSFINHNVVQNQAGVQDFLGSTYFGPVFHGSVQYVNQIPKTHNAGTSFIDVSAIYDDDIKKSLAFPEMSYRRLNIEDHHPSTCQWVLDLSEYKDWISRPRGLLWVKGKPGAGKSTLMAFLYKRLKTMCHDDNEISLDFFFTARGTELQRSPIGMIRSLLNQLFVQDQEARPAIREAFDEKLKAFGSGERLWDWQRRELESLFSSAVIAAAQRKQVRVFVDALDEAGEKHSREIAAFFHQINDRLVPFDGAQLRICISCRHYPIPAIVTGIEIHVEKYNHQDIRKFVKDHLSPALPASVNSDEKTAWNDLVDDIILRADGVFQWVALIISLVEGYIADGYELREIQTSICQVPTALGDIYEFILRNVIRKEHRSLSLRLFQWVCMSKRPLEVRELRYALAANDAKIAPKLIKCHETFSFIATDQRMESRINALSGGLVEVVSYYRPSSGMRLNRRRTKFGYVRGSYVQVIHHSVEEFLRSHGLGLITLLSADVPRAIQDFNQASESEDTIEEAHKVIFQSCINYFSTEFAGVSDLEALLPKGGGIARLQVLDTHFAFLSYATEHLFVHAQTSGGFRNKQHEYRALCLLSVFEYWKRSSLILKNYFPPSGIDRSFLSNGTTILHAAAHFGLDHILKHLLDQDKCDVDVTDDKGETALHAAARSQHSAVAQLLLNAGADIEATSSLGRSALYEAAGQRDPSFTQFLLDNGADVNNSRGSEAAVPLRNAVSNDNISTTEILLKYGADVDKHETGGPAALATACAGAQKDIVLLLLKAGASVNIGDSETDVPLYAAIRSGRKSIVRILLTAGADVNVKADFNGTALQIASYKGYDKIVQMLLAAGADVNAHGGIYGNALQACVASLDWLGEERDERHGNTIAATVSVVQRLLDAGANIDARGGRYKTALNAASYIGNTEVARVLIQASASLEQTSGGGITPLTVAITHGNFGVSQILLGSGANTASMDIGGLTPLHYAARLGCTKTVEAMRLAKAALEVQDKLGRTPLHHALMMGHDDLALRLLLDGARYNIPDKFGRTALEYVGHRLTLPDAIRTLLLTSVPAHHDVDVEAVRDYACCILQNLCNAPKEISCFRVYDLIHCFLQISGQSMVRPFFEMLRYMFPGGHYLSFRCSRCRNSTGAVSQWYTCSSCPFLDICEFCTKALGGAICGDELLRVEDIACKSDVGLPHNWIDLVKDDEVDGKDLSREFVSTLRKMLKQKIGLGFEI